VLAAIQCTGRVASIDTKALNCRRGFLTFVIISAEERHMTWSVHSCVAGLVKKLGTDFDEIFKVGIARELRRN